MTRLFLEDGKEVPVTVLQLDNLKWSLSAPTRKTATRLFNSALVKRKQNAPRRQCAVARKSERGT